MPTAASFDAAAAQFEAAASRLRAVPQTPRSRMGPQVIWGGALTESLSDVLQRLDSDTGAHAQHLTSLAAECRRRAAATRAAAAAHAAYVSAHNAYVNDVAAHNTAASAAADAGEPFDSPAPTAPSAPPTPPGFADF